MENNELRICSPGDLPGILEYDGKEFTGVSGHDANEFCKDLIRGLNASYSIYSKNEGMGESIDGSIGEFNGCIGRLQKNESDMMLRELTYPVTASSITQGTLVADSVVQFVSVYEARKNATAAQMIYSFTSFSTSVWALCFATLIAGWLILFINGKIRQKPSAVRGIKAGFKPDLASNKYKLYQVATHMSAKGSIYNSSAPSRIILFMILSLFCLLVLFYFGSIIKTELVVVEPPDIYSSYQDLLDHNVSITFTLILDTYIHYKFAPRGSPERKLWDASVARLGEDRVLFNAKESNIGIFARDMISRSLVYVTESLWIGIALNELCPVPTNQAYFDTFCNFFGISTMEAGVGYPLRSQDQHAIVLPKAFVFRSSKSPLLRHVREALVHLFEVGLMGRQTVNAERMNMLKSILGGGSIDGKTYDIVEKCKQGILIIPEPEVHGLMLANISGLLGLVLCLYALALLILIIENCCAF